MKSPDTVLRVGFSRKVLGERESLLLVVTHVLWDLNCLWLVLSPLWRCGEVLLCPVPLLDNRSVEQLCVVLGEEMVYVISGAKKLWIGLESFHLKEKPFSKGWHDSCSDLPL